MFIAGAEHKISEAPPLPELNSGGATESGLVAGEARKSVTHSAIAAGCSSTKR